MNPFTFIYPLLDALSKGSIIRKIYYAITLVLGVLIGIAGLVLLIVFLKYGFQDNVKIGFTIAAMFGALLVIVTTWIIVQIFFYRAKCIIELEDSPFTVIPIFSIIIRLFGEVYATLIAFATLVGFISILLTGMSIAQQLLREYIPFMPRTGRNDFFDGDGSQFVDAILMLITGFGTAFLGLIVFYLFAELFLLGVDIAKNTRTIAQGGGASSSETAAETTNVNVCNKCGSPHQPDDLFCMACGNKLK